MRSKFLFFILAFTSYFINNAQQLSSPKEFLGYELGTQFTRHHAVIDYFKDVEKSMPAQVRLEQYGSSYERRPLYVAYVSSEKNLVNLEQIRIANLARAGIGTDSGTAQDIAIVWLSYNVHGNEASSTEAAMNTIYKLLTEKQSWLENTVVIIDPCLNPDGRDRYVNWFNETASQPYDMDQQASEHMEPWPGGRPNHYLFDLNRDWAWATQIETASRLKIYNKWLPQIHVDFHEQGINEPYYFAPAAEPFHEIITDWQREFQTQIGKNHAKYFDAEGWLYFTGERFDLFYPSYGDTYPTYMGAIGMTYEQAGHGRGGLGILNDEGDELTLKDRLEHHTTTGLSTVEIASENAKQLNSEFSKFFDTSQLSDKSYVLQGHPDKIEAISELLDKHEIRYGYAKNGKVNGFDFEKNEQGQRSTTLRDLVVSTNQAKGNMVKVLFEQNAKLMDSLTYDITAWSIPYAYGVNAIASTKVVETESLPLMPHLNPMDKKAIGYILNWKSLEDAKFLADLLKQDIRVRFSEKPFETNAKSFERGALIIIRGDNKAIEDFDDKVVTTANKYKRTLTPALSGFSTSGPDFGSPDIKMVNAPKIAVLSGESTSSLSYGEVWHFFEQQLHYPMTSINTEHLARTNLDTYNILIMPNGYYGSLVDEALLKKLKDWVSAGGKIIAIDGALSAFSDKEGFGLHKKSDKPDEDKKDSKNEAPKIIKYADRERNYAKDLITGAIFKTKVDETHPMAFGYDESYYTLKLGNSAYKILEDGYTVAHLGDSPKSVSGFAGSEAIKDLDNSLIFGEQPIGSGSMVYLVDNVLFRSFWENGKLFFVNSIFFVNNNLMEL